MEQGVGYISHVYIEMIRLLKSQLWLFHKGVIYNDEMMSNFLFTEQNILIKQKLFFFLIEFDAPYYGQVAKRITEQIMFLNIFITISYNQTNNNIGFQSQLTLFIK